MIVITDHFHAVQAWTVLMRQSGQFTHDQLWFGTSQQPHAVEGPSWFVIPPTAVAGMANVCHQLPKGIALRCSDVVQALAHARKVLDTPLNGNSVLRFDCPQIWTALALEAADNLGCLLGPWDAVYTPAPGCQPNAGRWHEWRVDPSVSTTGSGWPLAFPDTLFSTYKDVRWVHWIRDNPVHFGQVPDSDLPRLVRNLDFLVAHRIGVDEDLLEITHLIIDGELSERIDLLPVLSSAERPHRKVIQLQEARQS